MTVYCQSMKQIPDQVYCLSFLDSILLAPCINFSQSNKWQIFASPLRLAGTVCNTCLEKYWVSVK